MARLGGVGGVRSGFREALPDELVGAAGAADLEPEAGQFGVLG